MVFGTIPKALALHSFFGREGIPENPPSVFLASYCHAGDCSASRCSEQMIPFVQSWFRRLIDA